MDDSSLHVRRSSESSPARSSKQAESVQEWPTADSAQQRMPQPGQPYTSAWDSLGRSNSRRERGSLCRSAQCRGRRAPGRRYRRTRAKLRSAGRTCAGLPATAPDELAETRNIGQCDRLDDSLGGAEFRNRTRIPRLSACARGFLHYFIFLLLWPQQREENYIANRFGIREQHRQTINAYSLAAGWRHAVRKRPNIVFVHRVCFLIAALPF